MEPVLNRTATIAVETLQAVLASLAHNWLPLSLAIFLAAAMKVHADAKRLERALSQRTHASILGSVALGAFTPLCACGTMAVVLGMLTATVPWAPIMAFLTSSPLMSPDGFVLLAGVVGAEFAAAVAIASVVIGLGSGYVTHLVETRTGFLAGQTRFAGRGASDGGAGGSACGCATPAAAVQCCAGAGPAEATAVDAGAGAAALADPLATALRTLAAFVARLRLPAVTRALRDVGARQILASFALFVAIGHLINRFAPVELIGSLFGASHSYSVPFAALVGLPFYVTTESSVPIIEALMRGGASKGAMLAFMITGPATSAWVVAGLTTFLRSRAIALYLGFVLVGGILAGYGYELFLAVR